MALMEKYLYVKKSSLPNAGQGLFTKKYIPKGTYIVEYKGRRCTWKEVEDEIDNGYIFYINRNKVVNALPYKKALARYANDAMGLERVNGLTNNAIYVIDGDKVFIESTKNIPPGSEIFVKYGGDYWKRVRENIKLEEQQKKEEKKKK